MSRLAMPAAMPAEIAERLSDVPSLTRTPDFSVLDDCKDVISDIGLAKALNELARCKGSTAEEYERARNLVERALYSMWEDL